MKWHLDNAMKPSTGNKFTETTPNSLDLKTFILKALVLQYFNT